MNAFTFPQPGERTNSSAVLVQEEYLGTLLIVGARDYAEHPCPFGTCSHCEEYVRQWHDSYHRLGDKQALRVDAALNLEGLDVPGGLF